MKKFIFSFIIFCSIVSVCFALEYDPNSHNIFVKEYVECCKACDEDWADTSNVDYSDVRDICKEECEEEYQRKLFNSIKEKAKCFIGLTN